MSQFLPHATSNELRRLNEKTCNGFMILFDIKDSTARKSEYRDVWPAQTQALYEAFQGFCSSLPCTPEHPPVIKYIGDGLTAFFRVSNSGSSRSNESVPTSTAIEILELVISFLRDLESEDRYELLGGMRLKSVVSYLTGIHLIDVASNGRDILGSGVDLTHRLETYADATHIVLNDAFGMALLNASDAQPRNATIKIGAEVENFALIPCTREVRGWSNGQRFWLLTNPDMIRQAAQEIAGNRHDQHAKSELLRYFVEWSSKQTAALKTEANAEKTDWRRRADSDG